jgi:hypothetical protein
VCKKGVDSADIVNKRFFLQQQQQQQQKKQLKNKNFKPKELTGSDCFIIVRSLGIL